MTQTIHLTVKKDLTELLSAIPGVHAAFLNRDLPVGENETQQGAVIIVREEVTRASTDNQRTLPLEMVLRVSVYIDIVVGGPTVDELTDDIWQQINTIMHGSARDLPGVQGVTFEERQPEAQGDAARVDLFYTVKIRVNQLDLTTAAS